MQISETGDTEITLTDTFIIVNLIVETSERELGAVVLVQEIMIQKNNDKGLAYEVGHLTLSTDTGETQNNTD